MSVISNFIRRYYLFYPGTHWLRRMGFIFLVYLIGPNLYLNQLQDRLFDYADVMIDRTGEFTGQAALYARQVQTDVVPILREMDTNPDMQYLVQMAGEYILGKPIYMPTSRGGGSPGLQGLAPKIGDTP